MAETNKKVILFQADTTQVLKGIKNIEDANSRMVQSLGGAYGKIERIIGQTFSQAQIKQIVDAKGQILGVADASTETAQKIKILGGQYGTLTTKTVELADGTQKITTSFKQASASSETFGEGISRLYKRALVTIPVWLVLRSALMGFISIVQSSIKFLIDWEHELAQMAIVSGVGVDSLKALSGALINTAKDFGISYKEMGQSAKLWAQQGRSISEIIPLMKTTAQMSLLTGQTTAKAVENITAVINAYKIEAKDSINIIDSMTNVFLKNAITAEDLSSAYKQVASTASTLGVSFEELTGYITAIKAVTRDSGSKTGLSLRTMFSRITTSSAESIQKLAGVPLYLDNIGKATFTVTPRMRNLGDVLSELSVKWKDLGNVQKSQLASLVGGVRLQNQVFSLFNNFTQAITAQTQAMFGLGASSDAVKTLTSTTKAEIEKLKNSWFSLIESIGSTEIIKGTISLINRLVTSLDKIISPRKADYKERANELAKQNDEYSRQIYALEQVAKYQEIIEGLRRQAFRATKEEQKIIEDYGKTYRDAFNVAMRELGFDFKITGSDSLDDFIKQLDQINIKAKDLKVDAIVGQQITNIKSTILTDGQALLDYFDIVIKQVSKTVANRKAFEDFTQSLYIQSLKDPKVLALPDITSALSKGKQLSKETSDVLLKMIRDFSGLSDKQIASVEKLLDLYNSGTESISDENKLREKTLEHLHAQKTYEEQIQATREIQVSFQKTIIDHMVEMKSTNGVLSSDLIKYRMNLEKQFGIEKTINEKLSDRLKLEQELSKEKRLQSKLGGDSIKLFNIAKESGVDVAREIGKVLSGDISFGRFVSDAEGFMASDTARQALEQFKKNWADLFEAQQAEQFFLGKPVSGEPTLKGGRIIPIEERDVLAGGLPTRDSEAQLIYLKTMAEYLRSIAEKPVSNAQVDVDIPISIDVDSKDEIGNFVIDRIARELPQTGTKINRAVAQALYNKQTPTV